MKLTRIKNILVIMIIAFGFACKKPVSNFGSRIGNDPQLVAQGQTTFNRLCSACHNFGNKAIGPNLSGITRSVETEWIKDFIRNPQKVIDSKDERAVALFEEFKIYMLGFPTLENNEIEGILSYLHTYDKLPEISTDSEFEELLAIGNPIVDSIEMSETILNLDFLLQIPASHSASPYTRINKIDCERVSGRLFVNDLRGLMYEIVDNKPSKYLQLDSLMEKFITEPGLGTGFGSFAFHPDFDKNGLLYTTHTEAGGTKPADFAIADSIEVLLQWVVTEWKSDDPQSSSFMGSNRELLRIDFVAGIHGMQEITFNPNSAEGDSDFGKLYIGLGDGGSTLNGYPNIANHNGYGICSSILRIDPLGNNSQNQMYGIPVDNPFAEEKNKTAEIWAFGFRNPNKITWDKTGRLLATDIGQAQIEEINIVEPGRFYGWPIREGSFMINPYGDISVVYPLPDNDDDFSVSYPFLEFDHDEAAAISGGYLGKGIHKGKYIFGDIPTGKVFVSQIEGVENPIIRQANISVESRLTNFVELTGDKRTDLRFGQDCSGTVYAFTKADGRIYKIRDN